MPVQQVQAYSLLGRVAAAVLFVISRASLLLILALVLTATNPPVTPPILFRLVVILSLLPGLAAWLVERAFAAQVTVGREELVLHRRGERIEVPRTAIDRVVPWALPLPGPGLWLWTRSGPRLSFGLQLDDPTPLLAALADAGVNAARAAMRHPTLVDAHAKQQHAPRRWHHLAAKFVLFALFPAAVLFNTHQHIAYGGGLGQYYLLGLAAYLETFVVYWSTVSIYLVLYASVWRALAEALCLLAAWRASAHSAAVRRMAELACQLLYYGGVPVLLALRFLV